MKPENFRIGSVPYLNARPLIFGIEERVTLCVPSRLADLLARGQFDAGLVPVAEVLAHDRYDLVDGIAIASHGPVKSVFLYHSGKIENLTQVAADPASRSSVMLLRVILKHRYGIVPEIVREAGAYLLIGDNAIQHQTKLDRLDLGAAWRELTGLPFVYAAWALQRDLPGAGELAAAFRQAKANGLAHLDEIVQDATEATPEFRREYLTRCIRYELGAAEKAGLQKFQELAAGMGIVPARYDLRYIA